MNALVIAALLLVLLTVSYQLGWSRSRKLADGKDTRLHSRPIYHGVLAALFALLPAIVVLGLWALFSPSVTNSFILAQLPAEVAQQEPFAVQASIARVQSIASGYGVIGEPTAAEAAAANDYDGMDAMEREEL